MTDVQIPSRPLERFLDLLDALLAERRWFEDVTALRYAASSLVTLPGEPARVARDLRVTAAALEEQAGWFGPLKSPVRFVVAAMLLRHATDVAGFTSEITRIEALFRERKLARRSLYTCLAAMLLLTHARDQGRRVDESLVARFAALFAELKSHHGFLTGQDDYPACALLTGLEGQPSAIAARCERFYDGLRDLGFTRGNALQSVSHMLVFAPEPDTTVMRRFRALYSAFDDAGLWMHTGDYDEVASLSFLDQPTERVVARVLEHREQIAAYKPKPGKELSFSLACATGFLELAGGDDNAALRDTANALAVQNILQAQQMVMMTAAVSASVAATSASH